MPRLSSKRKRFLRAELRNIYGNKCIYCGRDLTHTLMTIEHVIPRSQGGTNHISNLRPACEFCNSTHANPLEADRRPKSHLTFDIWIRRREKFQFKKQKFRQTKPYCRWLAPCIATA